MSLTRFRWSSIVALAAIAALPVFGCSAAPSDPDSDELVGAPESEDTRGDALVDSLPVGTVLAATTDVNLRKGPSTSKKILHVIPNGAHVTLMESAPSNGFYKVKHDGTEGWSFGAYYEVVAMGGDSGGASSLHEEAIARAKSGKGFSYWWGHGRFRPEGPSSGNAGSCSGSCPSCSHGGSYGGDCSGFVAKAWQVPASNDDLTDDEHPYSTATFVDDTSQWHTVSRGSLQQADAMVYNSDGKGHIFLYSKGDGWGSMYAYECKGCSYGCVAGYRTASSSYHGIRRTGY